MRRLAAFCVAAIALALPASSAADNAPLGQYIDFGGGSTRATFGANAQIFIDEGNITYLDTCLFLVGPDGVNDFIWPSADIYIVPTGTSDGADLEDVSETPNTVTGVGGGLFISEPIGITATKYPIIGNPIGEGVYDVVYDECMDGKYQASHDALFEGAITVEFGTDIPDFPSASFVAQKLAAQAAQQALEETHEWLEDVLDSGYAAASVMNPMVKFIKAAGTRTFLADPGAVTLLLLANLGKHYEGIAADPPDPAFDTLTLLGARPQVEAYADDPLQQANALLATASAQEEQLANALLRSMERYQGAQAAGDSRWALEHARGMQRNAAALAAAVTERADALAELATALTADTRDLDAAAAELDALADGVRANGLTEDQVRIARNLGLDAAEIEALEADLAARDYDGFSKAAALTSIGELQADAAGLSAQMAAFGTGMQPVVDQLHADMSVPEPAPLADAGGPYTGTVGAPLALDASGSSDPGSGPITGYAWDLDGDGAFDDATGATPSHTYTRPFAGLVAVQVSNANASAVDYARVDVTTTNGRPVVERVSPASADPLLAVGDPTTFEASVTDPDGDATSIQWKVDGAAVPGATGTTFTYTPALGDVGPHAIQAEATDAPATGGVGTATWTAIVEADDADADGWNANADCQDADPDVYPGATEVVGNGVDDDCDAATPDDGSAPTAAIGLPAELRTGFPLTFADESTDPNDDIVERHWDFGDGETSSEQAPTHTYAVKGTYTLSLTVTDATGRSDTESLEIVVATPPTAGFTWQPPSPAEGGEVDFTDVSVDSDGTVVAWSWDFGDGGTSTAQNPTHIFLAAGEYDVTLTVTDDDGSTASVTHAVAIGVGDPGTAPSALFRPDVPGRDLAATANGGTVVASSGWCCGGHEPWVMLDDDVGYPWATSNASAGHFATIQIGSTPRMIDSVQVQPRSDGWFDQRVRDFAVDVSTTGTDAADFTQVLLATAADSGTLQTFELPPGTQAKYVRYRPLNNRGACCNISTSKLKVLTASSGPRTVTFENQSTNAVSYRWDFGDGGTSTDAEPAHTYDEIGTYTVTLVAKGADGRTSTFSRLYEARGPTADFTVEPAQPEPGVPAVFRDASLSPSSAATTFLYDFGDGTTGASAGALHTYAAAGTYTVTYTVTDAEGNADTVTKEVTVAEPGADAPPTARFAPASGGVNVAFSGAGASIHSFSSQYSGSYPATTILDENAGNSYWATANTVRSGWVKVDLAGDLAVVDRIRIAGDGGTERVKNFKVSVSSTTADDAAFSEVLSATNPNDDNLREYVFPGGPVPARYVRLDLLDNWGHPCCVSIDRLDVFTGPVSLAGRNLALAADGASIAGFSGQHSDPYPVGSLIDANPGNNPWLTTNGVTAGWAKVTLSSGAPRMIDRVRVQPRWGGQKVKDFEVAVSTTGTADADFVTVLAATAQDNESLQTFRLPYPMPAKHVLYRVKTNRTTGNFTGTGDLRVDTGQESAGTTVHFRNLSRGATSYAWDFGDGSTSTAPDPVHEYAAPGTYTVTLTATNGNGSSTFTLEQVVRAATFSYSPAAPEAQQQVDFLDTTPAELGLVSWSWDFGDGTASSFQNPVKTFAAAGTYTVRMTGTDREGNAFVAEQDVVVATPSFKAMFHPRGTSNVASLENGAAVVAFSSQLDAGTWSAPKLLDAFTNTAWHSASNQTTKWMKLSLAGGATYQVDRFLLLGRQDCCHDQHPRDFEIAVSTTGTDDADFKVVLRATLPAGQTTPQTFMLPRPVPAKYVLYRTLTNRGSTVVTTAMLKAASGQVGGATVTFDDLTVGGSAPLAYAWDFGDGGTSSEPSPTHTFPGPGTYDVTLTVTDADGAASTHTLTQRVLAPLAPAFSNAPVEPNEAQSTSFTDTTPPPAGGPIVERVWAWGDGTANTTTTAAGTSHTFADSGTYPVTLTVRDAWGQTGSFTQDVVVRNVAPTVDAGPDWRWREERALAATPTTSDPAGTRDPLTCTWEYGDGTPDGTGCAFSHVYADPGDYTATVTVSDGDGGVSTDSFAVEVIEKEAPPTGGGSGSGGGTGVGKAAQDYTYTLDADFELGTLLNVNHDAPGNDQLQLNKEAKPFPFVYIAASSRGTALRIDVNTGEILGEYRTAPENRSKNPSRTTVDKLGNVWVTNRDESERRTIDGVDTNWGSAARVGLLVGGTRVNADGAPNPTGEYVQPPFEYNTCVDRNGDGLIRTSRGRGHILRWQNTTGVDHDGGVETAEDECIQLYVRVRGINTRTVGIDANNDAWIGGANNWHEKVDGDTGQRVPGTAFDLNCGGYGGLVDRNGILWSARYGAGLLRYDTNTKTGVCLGNSHGDYGLGVDPVTGNIWHSALGGNWVVKLNPAATTASTIELARYRHGYNDAQGVAVDSKGSVWVAHALFSSTHVGRVATDGTFLGNAHLGGGHGSTGVSVDGNGKVWSANINSNSATRIDPEVGQKIAAGRPPSGWFDLNVDLGPGAGPYNYSDMTGSVSIGAASPSGFWSIKQDAGAAGTIWKRISWDGDTPEGTTIVTEVRAADSQTELPSRSFVEVTNGAPLAGVAGRYIEVRTTLQTSDGAVTPVLREIRVTANTPPVAQDLTAVTDRDTPVEIDLLATDEESDPLAYAIVAAPAHGTAELLGGNRVRYTPEPGYFGPDSFTYRASDDSADSNVATVTIDVVQTNVSPVAVDDVYTVHSGRTLTVDAPGVLGNDTDADGDALSFGGFGPVSDGTIAGSPDGSFTYTPPSGFTGSVTVAYLVLDGQGGEDSGTVTIHVVNSSPVAVDDEYTVHGSHELTVAAPGVLANDTDADGDTLRWAGFGPVSDGTISGNADGGFTYTPPAGFTGAVTVAYLVVDGHGGQDTGALTIRVVNSAPVAVDDEYTVHSGRTLTVDAPGLLENDTDADGDTLRWAGFGPVSNGTISGNADGSFTYTPPSGFTGTVTVPYLVLDGNGGEDSGTLTIHVVNSSPVAADDEYTVRANRTLTVDPPGVLANDTDADGDPLVWGGFGPVGEGTISGSADGGFTYTPPDGFTGTVTVPYLVLDGNGGEDTGAVTIHVVNSAPVADDRTIGTDEDTPVPIELTATDADGDDLTFAVAAAPANGAYAGGVYTPNANFSGTDSITFLVTDGHGGMDVGTITIDVRPVNDPPVVEDVTAATDEDTPVAIALTAADVDGGPATFTWTDPANGSFDGTTYTPNANFNGVDTFEYTASDGNGGTDTALVTVTVRPVNDPPAVTLAGPATVAEGGTATFTASAADVDGDAVVLTWHDGSTGPAWTISPDDGPATVLVRVTADDGNGGTDAAERTLAVTNVPPEADAGPDQTAYWGILLTFAGSGSDVSPVDAASLVFGWAFSDGATAAGATVTHAFAEPGAYDAVLTVTDKDGGAGTDTATATIERRPTTIAITSPPEQPFGAVRLTARLADAVDPPSAQLEGLTIVFAVGELFFTAATDADGVASVDPGLLPPGEHEVFASFVGSPLYLASGTSAPLTVLSTAGKVTAGVLRSVAGGRGGFNVQSDGTIVKGELQFQNAAGNFHAHELTSLAIAPDGRRAWFAGVLRDGRPFTAYVEDNGEPGRNDRFRLTVAGSEQAGDGRLSGGNVQIHR